MLYADILGEEKSLFGHSELRKPPGGKGTLRRGWIRSKEGRARPRGAAPGYPPGETGVKREGQLPKPQPVPTPKPDQDYIARNDVDGAGNDVNVTGNDALAVSHEVDAVAGHVGHGDPQQLPVG